MIFDENIPTELVAHFRDQVSKVAYAGEPDLKGTTNGRLWELARKEEAIILTQDTGFRRRYSYQGRTEVGVVLLSLRHQIPSNLISAFKSFLGHKQWDTAELIGRLIIVSERGILIRSPGETDVSIPSTRSK